MLASLTQFCVLHRWEKELIYNVTEVEATAVLILLFYDKYNLNMHAKTAN